MATKKLQIVGSLVEQTPQIQADYSQTDTSAVDYIKNKPFYDERVISTYSYNENPNPVSFDCSAVGYSFYKVSDLVLSKDEIFNTELTITVRGSSSIYKPEKFTQDNVLIETDEFILCQESRSDGYAFCFCNTIGTCNFTYMGYPLSINVPEAGIYRVNGMGGGMGSIFKVEFYVGGELKQIDSKYIPDMYYDTRIRSYYSQIENPNPISFNQTALNYTFYKVSDLLPTREQIFSNMKLLVDTEDISPTENHILLETDEFILVSNSGYAFIFINTSGTLHFTYSGYPLSIEVPEVGVYYVRDLGSGIPEGRTIEVQIGNGELKQIDPKYIPANLDFNLNNYYTKTEVDAIIGDCNTVLDEINALIGE